MHPIQAPQLMRDALSYAITQRSTVHLSIPEDIQSSKLAPEHHVAIRHFDLFQQVLHSSSSSEEALGHVIRFLHEFEKMRIVVAVGHLAVGVGPEVTELAELLNAPIVTRLDAKGIIDESHPLCLGVVGIHGNPGLEVTRDILESADAVIAVGVEDQMQGQMVLQDGAQTRDLVLIMPDTANFTGRFMLSGCLIGNLRSSLVRLTEALQDRARSSVLEPNTSLQDYRSRDPEKPEEGFSILLAWEHYLSGQWRQARHRMESASHQPTSRYKPADTASGGDFCHPCFVYDALNRRLGRRDTLCVDVGDQTLWASFLGHLTKGTRTLSDEFMGCMGYALPAAIAASLMHPDGVHVGVVGDGAFQMTLNELATAVQHGCRIVMVVFCNKALGRVKFGFGANEISGTQIMNPDYVALAKSFGAEAVRVDRPEQAEAAVEAAFAASGVFLIEVTMDPTLRAEMAKVHDMRGISSLAGRLGELLPESMSHLRRPQALMTLLEHFQQGHSGSSFTDEEVEDIKAMLVKWRHEYASRRGGGSGITEADDAALSNFLMDRIHKLTRVEFSLGAGPQHALPTPTNSNRPAVITFKGEEVPCGRLPEDFPGAYPAEFLKDSLQIDAGDPAEFAKSWRTAVSHLFKAKATGEAELEEFMAGGLSNGRSLKWVIMDILPNRNFPLHAHPNIESIYVARGTLHEMRLSGLPPTREFPTDNLGNPEGPDLSTEPWTFEHNILPEGSFLVNEIGSVHQSYTENEGVVLLVLWGGCHANVTKPRMPQNAMQAGFRPLQLLGADEPEGKQEESKAETDDEGREDKIEQARAALMRQRSLFEPHSSFADPDSEVAPELKGHREVLISGKLSKQGSLPGGLQTITLSRGLSHNISMNLGTHESVEIQLHKDGKCTCMAKDVIFLTT